MRTWAVDRSTGILVYSIAQIAAMQPIVLRVAEARMCYDAATMIESCPHCSLKRGGEYGYAGKHDEKCIVTQARSLGF